MPTAAHPESTPDTATVPHAEALFDHWLAARGNDAWTPLTAEAAKPYRFIWGAWSKYLAGQLVPPVAWHDASAVQVLHFINHIPQTVKGRKVSDITRRRYWRVLDRVYDHALLNGWIEVNPVHAVARGERPPSEDPKGAILSEAMWQAGIAQIPAGDDLVGARDRAVLMLLFELGLAPEELRMLRVDNILYSEPLEGSGEKQIIGVHVEGQRDNQQRKLSVSIALAQGLAHWLRARAVPCHAGRALAVLLAQVAHAFQPHVAASGDQDPGRSGPLGGPAHAGTAGAADRAQYGHRALAERGHATGRGRGTRRAEECQRLAAPARPRDGGSAHRPGTEGPILLMGKFLSCGLVPLDRSVSRLDVCFM
ncbi:tyrosine-type recombinase/integrase [Comamonas endophytica]|uniref:tyrosine-type recombinase/integrase n=1 Tax=Comamonas endophytica TaxID=2949090 RepID=UPI003606B68F